MVVIAVVLVLVIAVVVGGVVVSVVVVPVRWLHKGHHDHQPWRHHTLLKAIVSPMSRPPYLS